MVRARNVGKFKSEATQRDWEQEEFNSRTEIKLAAQAVTDIGVRTAALSSSTIQSFDLPDPIFNAILELKRLSNGSAIKRQRAYVGKLLRQDEAALIQLKAHLHRLDNQHLLAQQQLKQWEHWREKLITQGDEALSDLIRTYPQLDRNQFRQMIRNAQQEASQQQQGKAFRAIFQALKNLADDDSSDPSLDSTLDSRKPPL